MISTTASTVDRFRALCLSHNTEVGDLYTAAPLPNFGVVELRYDPEGGAGALRRGADGRA